MECTHHARIPINAGTSMQPHRLVGVLALAIIMIGLWTGNAVAADTKPALAPPAGSDPSSWAPVPITPRINGTIVMALLGQTLVLDGFPATAVVETSNTAISLVTQGMLGEPATVDGVTTQGEVTNPTVQTLGVGAALVVVRDAPAGQAITKFVLQVSTVTGKGSMLDREPLLLNAGVTTLALNESGERLRWDFANYTAASSNESVLTSTGYSGRRMLTAVGYGKARVIISRGGKELATLKVNITRTPRFDFHLGSQELTASKNDRVVSVIGSLAQPLPRGVDPPKVCAYHVTPRTRLGCGVITTGGTFTISSKAVLGTAVVEYQAGPGKSSSYFNIGIEKG